MKTIAMFIDAENVDPNAIKPILCHLSQDNDIALKRAYADWSNPNSLSWKPILQENAIQPVMQARCVVNKNSTDIALVIDAMDMLYSKRYHAFCIVSSDSDFTRLATRIREEGLEVYGYGKQNTSGAFVKACTRFTAFESLLKLQTQPETPQALPVKQTSAVKPLSGDTKLVNILRHAIKEAASEEGWALLGMVGHCIAKHHQDFSTKKYGSSNLKKLIKDIGLFDIEERHHGTSIQIWVRDRRAKIE